ncbi:MAG: 3-deoxy-D-manno-octulosonic acid transferase [Paracidovorax wautersii]|uniref:3-deoxy-D-manno-octulosonic acid transferase n=1 Tax=Paracidovorax wautersii TaxID=1177982 RepID=A0A7V8FNH0_9BURK|nr:MAG: 3-deoxy-D-manno-octulosonic acid transferase [Paracidovorax wautersii]
MSSSGSAAEAVTPPPAAWRQRASLALYSGLLWLAQPLVRRKLRRRGRQEPDYVADIEQRFGHYPAAVRDALIQRPAQGPRIWLHAVSLGETRAAGILIPALRARWPGLQLVLTCSTATGRQEGRRHLRDGDLQLWLPWDTRAAARRFVQAVRPDLGLLMETEIWPNLMAQLSQAGVPTVLVNARLNEKSTQGALRWPALMVPAYARFARVLAQSAGDAERLARVGARDVRVRGNLKYDAQPDAAQIAQAQAWRQRLDRPVALFASSREGEEAALLAALAADTRAQPAQWLVVPRHPQRFDAVAELAERQGWTVRRRSAWGDAGPPPDAGGGRTLWLGDSMGEMALYYALADVALLGGSFEPLGGQNLIEAAACGCPVVMGPHTFNFAQACEQAEAAGAAQRVAGLPQAVAAVRALLDSPDRLAAMRAASAGFVAGSQGAVQATVQDLAPLLPGA